MNDSIVIYFGQPARVICDRQCQKAWGISQRPSVQFSNDDDDIAYLADNELELAPVDPGTYEGGVGKPLSPDQFPTKWCVRECERSAIGEENESLTLPDFSKRRYNMPWLHEDAASVPQCQHEWRTVYYGTECKKCRLFYADGCEPWLPIGN